MTTNYVSITDFGAVGDGKTDNRATIQKAIDFAKANGKDVYVPEGNFIHKGLLTLNGVDMYGAGDKSVLKAIGAGDQSVQLTGSGASLQNLTLDSDATTRGTKGTNAKIFVNGATDFDVEGVSVLNSYSAGMMIYNSSNGVVRNNSLTSTNADSIHMTAGSRDILVQGNRIQDAGDDGIAVVTYGTTNVARDITITGNVVLSNNWGRDISVVGGENVKITGNYIDGNDAGLAGVYLATEPAYNTAGVKNVLVDGNTILNTGSTAKGHGNIMLYDGTSQSISGVTISNNFISGMGIRSNGSGIQTTQTNNAINSGGSVPAVPNAGVAYYAGTAAANPEPAPSPAPTPDPAPSPAPVADTDPGLTDPSLGTTLNDSLSGGDSADNLRGAIGDDALTGGGGADSLFGNQGNDVLQGDDGSDLLHGGQGPDLLYGGVGADMLYGDLGYDSLRGGQGADQLFGNRGADVMYGDLGDDLLHGGQGMDQLFGEAGNDTLFGDRGDDLMTGGAGADLFAFRDGNGSDTIADFSFGDGDRIQLPVGSTFTVSTSSSGSAELQLSGGGTITLDGVFASDVQNSWIVT